MSNIISQEINGITLNSGSLLVFFKLFSYINYIIINYSRFNQDIMTNKNCTEEWCDICISYIIDFKNRIRKIVLTLIKLYVNFLENGSNLIKSDTRVTTNSHENSLTNRITIKENNEILEGKISWLYGIQKALIAPKMFRGVYGPTPEIRNIICKIFLILKLPLLLISRDLVNFATNTNEDINKNDIFALIFEKIACTNLCMLHIFISEDECRLEDPWIRIYKWDQQGKFIDSGLRAVADLETRNEYDSRSERIECEMPDIADMLIEICLEPFAWLERNLLDELINRLFDRNHPAKNSFYTRSLLLPSDELIIYIPRFQVKLLVILLLHSALYALAIQVDSSLNL